MNIKQLDTYCRLHNKVVITKNLKLTNGVCVQYLTSSKDNYYVGVING